MLLTNYFEEQIMHSSTVLTFFQCIIRQNSLNKTRLDCFQFHLHLRVTPTFKTMIYALIYWQSTRATRMVFSCKSLQGKPCSLEVCGESLCSFEQYTQTLFSLCFLHKGCSYCLIVCLHAMQKYTNIFGKQLY